MIDKPAFSSHVERLKAGAKQNRPWQTTNEGRVQAILDANIIGLLTEEGFKCGDSPSRGWVSGRNPENKKANYVLLEKKGRHLFLHGRDLFTQENAQKFFDGNNKDSSLFSAEAVTRCSKFLKCWKSEACGILLEEASTYMVNPYNDQVMANEKAMAEMAANTIRREMLPPLLSKAAHKDGWIFTNAPNTKPVDEQAKMHSSGNRRGFFKNPARLEDSALIVSSASGLWIKGISSNFSHEATHCYDLLGRRNFSFAQKYNTSISAIIKNDQQNFHKIKSAIEKTHFPYTEEAIALLKPFIDKGRIGPRVNAFTDYSPTAEMLVILHEINKELSTVLSDWGNDHTANSYSKRSHQLHEIPARIEKLCHTYTPSLIKAILPELYNAVKENRRDAYRFHSAETSGAGHSR